jgi:hypothetical protein
MEKAPAHSADTLGFRAAGPRVWFRDHASHAPRPQGGPCQGNSRSSHPAVGPRVRRRWPSDRTGAGGAGYTRASRTTTQGSRIVHRAAGASWAARAARRPVGAWWATSGFLRADVCAKHPDGAPYARHPRSQRGDGGHWSSIAAIDAHTMQSQWTRRLHRSRCRRLHLARSAHWHKDRQTVARSRWATPPSWLPRASSSLLQPACAAGPCPRWSWAIRRGTRWRSAPCTWPSDPCRRR